MLTHPTLDKLQALRLTGMARAPKIALHSTMLCIDGHGERVVVLEGVCRASTRLACTGLARRPWCRSAMSFSPTAATLRRPSAL
jgi:hypothetical protein